MRALSQSCSAPAWQLAPGKHLPPTAQRQLGEGNLAALHLADVQAESREAKKTRSYPDGVADNPSFLCLGDDVTVFQGVFVLLPICDNNEYFLGTVAGPILAMK